MAIRGGIGLIVGSNIASLNPVIGPRALVPAVGGIVMAAASWIGVRRLDREKSVYRPIAERLAAIVKAIE